MAERNVNLIIPSYCHLPVNCRNLVDRCGSLGSCEPQIKFLNLIELLTNCEFRKHINKNVVVPERVGVLHVTKFTDYRKDYI